VSSATKSKDENCEESKLLDTKGKLLVLVNDFDSVKPRESMPLNEQPSGWYFNNDNINTQKLKLRLEDSSS
jgi:hypothetical protein